MSKHPGIALRGHRILIVFLVALLVPLANAAEPEAVTVYYFWGDGCPYCDQESDFLSKMQEKYPHMRLASYEVWYNAENRARLMHMADAFGIQVLGVPITFIGKDVWIGFNAQRAAAIEQAILTCGVEACHDAGADPDPDKTQEISEQVKADPDGEETEDT